MGHLMNHWCPRNNSCIYMCLEASFGLLRAGDAQGAQITLHALVEFGTHRLFEDPKYGRSCLVLASRIDKMSDVLASQNLKQVLDDARGHGLEVSADDAVESVSFVE